MLTSTPVSSNFNMEWSQLRANTPMTLGETDLERLRGINEQLSLDEVAQIYLSLSWLLNLYVAASQQLYKVTDTFLGQPAERVPYVIGVAGSVAVGKSTAARVLQALLARWPDHPKVDLVTTDGFLHSNETLEQRGLLDRKGFPESYDVRRLVRFMASVKAGDRNVGAPVYSHLAYDVLPDERETSVTQSGVMVLGYRSARFRFALAISPSSSGLTPRSNATQTVRAVG